MMTAEEQKIQTLVKNSYGGVTGEFRPCAYYDEPLDCIRVIARDCSVNEWRVSRLLTVLEDNYADPNGDLYVGFTIKGARHFCQQQGIDLTAPVKLSELLDRILAESTEDSVRIAVNAVAKPLVRKGITEVSLATAA